MLGRVVPQQAACRRPGSQDAWGQLSRFVVFLPSGGKGAWLHQGGKGAYLHQGGKGAYLHQGGKGACGQAAARVGGAEKRRWRGPRAKRDSTSDLAGSV